MNLVQSQCNNICYHCMVNKDFQYNNKAFRTSVVYAFSRIVLPQQNHASHHLSMAYDGTSSPQTTVIQLCIILSLIHI